MECLLIKPYPLRRGAVIAAPLLVFLILLLFPFTPALAQSGSIDKGDTSWMLTASALILLMTLPGLALFYGGMVRKFNVLSTIMQSFAITCLVAVIWIIIGYSFAFAGGNFLLGGFERTLLKGMDISSVHPLAPNIPESVFALFQMTFAIITPALMTGAIADRMRFSTLLAFTAIWIVAVYVPVAHWVWHPSGFLFQAGVLDFAGGTVVHINAGITGLVAALVLGNRHNYGTEHFPPHNLVLSVIGASLLWVGWFGFNAGSALSANGRAGMAALVTMASAAAAGLGWMALEWKMRGKPSILGIISGSIGGLVAITPASGFVDISGALLIGFAAGPVCYWGATSLKHRFGYDDSLDCFGIHGIGGILGAILTGVFAQESIGGVKGLLEGNAFQLLLQIYGVTVTVAYSAFASFILFKLLDVTLGLRVSKDIEREGLDLALHGEAVH